jgi:hypothetical protein
MRIHLLAIAAAFLALPANAEELYLDDRSDPAALVKSLYNAVNRKEYARAWSYFSTKPAADLDAYAQGYADTESVRVAVGVPSEEGAAGSVYYYLPVAIEARSAGSDSQIYAGCYELRLANPQIQAEDFMPLHIEKGSFSRSSKGLLEDALPATCNDGAPPDRGQRYEQRAKALFRDAFGQRCNVPDSAGPDEVFSSYAVQPPGRSEIHIYRFLCGLGAYNEGHIYVMADGFGEVKVLSFATPELEIRYEDDANEKVESINIIGFQSEQELVNSFFDPKTLSITSFAKWRGVGDASSTAHWILREGEFTLVRYDVDASYDGEMNEETILDYHSGP